MSFINRTLMPHCSDRSKLCNLHHDCSRCASKHPEESRLLLRAALTSVPTMKLMTQRMRRFICQALELSIIAAGDPAPAANPATVQHFPSTIMHLRLPSHTTKDRQIVPVNIRIYVSSYPADPSLSHGHQDLCHLHCCTLATLWPQSLCTAVPLTRITCEYYTMSEWMHTKGSLVQLICTLHR